MILNGQGQGKKIRKFLDWLIKINTDSVTIANPYLLQLIKKCYPQLETTISVIANVDSLNKVKYWEELGAGQITLSFTSLNRNFSLLREIRKSTTCHLQLIANLFCLHDYPFCFYHYLAGNHGSRRRIIFRNSFSRYYFHFLCQLFHFQEPYRFISAPWIRPEDISYYEQLGIDSIKLVDRRMKSEYICRVVGAYTKRKYDGNLWDLFATESKLIQNIFDKPPFKYLRVFINIKQFNILKLGKFTPLSKKLKREDFCYIDNTKLNGFIDFFIQDRCKNSNCQECGYCKKVADDVLTVPQDVKNDYINFYKTYLETMIDGTLFCAGK